VFKKLRKWFAAFWKDNVVANVIGTAAFAGLSTATWKWWDNVKEWTVAGLDLAGDILTKVVPVPLWLLSVLVVIALVAVCVVILAILAGRQSEVAADHPTFKSYTTDNFYGTTWHWRYGYADKIQDVTPLCPQCSCEVELIEHLGYPDGVSFRCIRCNHRSESMEGDYYRVADRVAALVRQKLRTGDWIHAIRTT
jgi:hypothetical protein